MEPIDSAAIRFEKLAVEIDEYKETLCTEQDARVKVIDKLFLNVLGWSPKNLYTEDHTEGGYLDYRFDVDNRAKLVVEAKRDGLDLGIGGRPAGRPFLISGPVFKSKAAKEGIDQAVRYCGCKNAELACVTNGRQWIIFRGSRCGDGKDTYSGMAFVFSSLDDIKQQFCLFYDLLSADSVRYSIYLAHFQEAEGAPIRRYCFRRPAISKGRITLCKTNEMIKDMGRVMKSFFGRLTGDQDPNLLAECFVTSKESNRADEQLARIAEGLAHQILNLETDTAGQLQELLDRATSAKRHEFIIIVGTKGAGKSTFIDRFFRYVLPKAVATNCRVLRVNLAESEGDAATLPSWLNRNLIAEAENNIFSGKTPSFDDIRGLYFDEYKRLSSGPRKHLYERDRETFYDEFGKWAEGTRQQQPHDYLLRLIHHMVALRKNVPIIVFDNADHFGTTFQEAVYQYARSIYERKLCVILLPITDRTSWELSRHGALQSFEHEALFLPTPPVWKIITKRLNYLEKKIAEEKTESGRGYFFGRGIKLDVENLSGFCSTLHRVFLRNDRVSRWISFLANHDVRRALTLTNDMVLSPHLRIDDLVKTYLVKRSFDVPYWRFVKALVRDKYNHYPVGQHRYVQNIFMMTEDHDTTPLLGLRLLQMLRDAPTTQDSGRFVSIDQINDYFRAMGIHPRVSLGWLDSLLKSGLCFSYDPTIVDADKADRIKLSPSGHQHLIWGQRNQEYLSAMAAVTQIKNPSTYEELTSLFNKPPGETWKDRLFVFSKYLILEDRNGCQIPNHKAYLGQNKLTESLRKYCPG